MLTWLCHLFQVDGGGSTSSSVVSAASAPASTVLPASVTAPSNCVDTGGGGLCRRRRPVMPVRPPVMPVTALSSPPTPPWTASWACSGGAECQHAETAAVAEHCSRAGRMPLVADAVAGVAGDSARGMQQGMTVRRANQMHADAKAAAQALHPPCSPAGHRLWLVVGSPAAGAWPEVGAPAPEC